MKCDEMRKYFDDYILGDLDQSIEIRLNEHLFECKDCQKEIKEKETLADFLKTSQKFKPSGEVYRRIRDNIKVGKKDKRILLWGFPRSFVYTVASFFLGIVLMRTIDMMSFRGEERLKVKAQYEFPLRVPFSDTVKFYAAPPENLARI